MLGFSPKLVIFDLDGTLVEFPRHFLFSEAERILRILEHPLVPREEIECCFADFDFFRFVDEDRRQLVIQSFWKNFDWSRYPRSTPISRAHEVLETLKKAGVRRAIATARISTPEALKDDLMPSGLFDYFCHVAARRDEQSDWKDKKVQISEICDRLEIHPRDAMMVGDIPADIVTARDAGVACTVAVLSGGIRRAVLADAKPDAIIEDIGSFLPLLLLPSS